MGAVLGISFALVFVAGFLIWVVGSAANTSVFLTGLIAGSFALAVPLIFGSMAGILSERAGVVNIAIEGQPCRFIEPLARQAEALAHALLERDHPGYRHAAPVVRLKTRQLPITLSGRPDPGADWVTVSDDAERLEMEQRQGERVLATLSVGAGRRAA